MQQQTTIPINNLQTQSLVQTTKSVCLCVAGSVAAVKTPDIVRGLLLAGVQKIDCVLSHAARKLLNTRYDNTVPFERLQQLQVENSEKVMIYIDSDEWDMYTEVGTSEVLHVELARRNQLLLIAPLCANTLASVALGFCSNLLSSVVLAWKPDRPVLVAPAMNTCMWQKHITQTHIETLRKGGFQIIQPVEKKLACGDVGPGAMESVSEIINRTVSVLNRGHGCNYASFE